MLKDKMVTRTINATNANVLCAIVDRENGTATTEIHTYYAIPDRYNKTDADVLKYINKTFTTDVVKPVAVMSVEKVSTLRGCKESIFLANATECDTRKGLNLETLITKTVSTTAVNALRVNVKTQNVFSETIYINSDYAKDNADALKHIQKNLDTPNIITVNAQIGATAESIRYMTISKFIEISDELPARATENK